jgi:hypothetical protein
MATVEELFANAPEAPSGVDELFANAPEETPQQQEPEFFDRLGSLVQGRANELAQTQADYEAGKIGGLTWAVQTVGKGLFGTVADIAGESVATLVSDMMPDEAEAYLKQVIASGAETVMSTDTAKELLAMYQTMDPQDRKTLESATNIAMGLVPAKGMGNAKPLGKQVEAVGKGMRASAKATTIARQKKAFSRLYTAKEGTRAAGRNESVLNTLIDVPDLKPSVAPEAARELIKNERKRLDDLIFADVAKSKNPPLSVNAINNHVNKRLDALRSSDPAYKQIGDTPFKQVSEMLDDHLVKFKQSGVTPKELIKLRKDLDSSIGLWKGNDKILRESGAVNNIVREFRNGLNDLIDSYKVDVDTAALRNKQSLLYTAEENLMKNSNKFKNKWQQSWDYAKAHPFAVGAAVSGTGLLAAPGVLPAVGATAAILGLNKANPAIRSGFGAGIQALGGVTPSATRSGLFYGYDENEDVQP